jgi:hypothetical protein
MAGTLPRFPYYCGELWEKFEEPLKQAGFNIEVFYIRPQREANPAGKPRLVLLRLKSPAKLQALLSYDNYLQEERAPRSQEAFFRVYGK